MRKLFNPVNSYLAASPAIKETKLSLRFWSVFISAALLLAAAWHFSPPKIRLTHQSLEFDGDHLSAIARAVNDTDSPVTVTLRFTIGCQVIEAKGNTRFLPLGEHIASYTLAPRATTRVSSEFPRPTEATPTQADIQLISYQ